MRFPNAFAEPREPAMDPHPPSVRRLRRTWALLGAAVLALTAAAVTLAPAASAATEFSDTFESGAASGWSKSGGTWTVVADGSQVLRQTNAGSENARDFNGSSSWTNVTVQARVKPLSLGSGGFVGLLARAAGSTRFYRLALLP